MCGNRAQDATKSHTRSEDAQDAQDANLTSLASGCKADVSDAPYIFADVAFLQVRVTPVFGKVMMAFPQSIMAL